MPSPWANQFEALLRASRSSVVICSPYIGRGPCDRMVRCLTRSGSPPTVHLLTDLSTDNLLSGATDAAALLTVAESLLSVFVRYLPRLHAKVYVRDEAEALVTSGNMTDSGLSRNHELGVRILDSPVVAQVRSHAMRLIELAALVPAAELRSLAEAASDLRQRWRASEASAKTALKSAFQARVSQLYFPRSDSFYAARSSIRCVSSRIFAGSWCSPTTARISSVSNSRCHARRLSA